MGKQQQGDLIELTGFLKLSQRCFFLELGGNDGLRGLSLNQTEQNLNKMVEKIRVANSEAIIFLCGMQIPPNLGQDYTEDFKMLFERVAKEKKIKFIPFLLDGIGGESALNLADGIHPNPEGHRIIAETIWRYLAPIL